jgi:hypothetical protein
MDSTNVEIIRELMTRSEPVLMVNEAKALMVFNIEVPTGLVRLSLDMAAYKTIKGGTTNG